MSDIRRRLMDLAAARPDLTVRELPGLSEPGLFVGKDGAFFIFVDRNLRDYKKTAVLAHELGHYVRRARDFKDGDHLDGRLRSSRAEFQADRCSRRLLMFVRQGLVSCPRKRHAARAVASPRD